MCGTIQPGLFVVFFFDAHLCVSEGIGALGCCDFVIVHGGKAQLPVKRM